MSRVVTKRRVVLAAGLWYFRRVDRTLADTL